MQPERGAAGEVVQRRRAVPRLIGVAMVLSGLALLVGVGVYYGYVVYAHSQLSELNYPVESSPSLPANVLREALVPPASLASVSRSSRRDSVGLQTASVSGSPLLAQNTSVEPAADSFLPEFWYASIYPGVQVHPKYWHRPMWAGSDPYSYQESGLPKGYRPVSDYEAAVPGGTASVAQRILMPAIKLDSVVNELAIVDHGDSRAYETPKNVVGHIPETSNPSERGNAWFFGHLESPIRGEGSVFRRLPEIPELLRVGDPVYVELQSADGGFLYKVTATRVVHQDDLRLYGSDGAEITLVSCVPRLVYDYRLLVSAKLVGIKS